MDFAYEGLEYSLDGGSAITLTALFEALGIDRSVEDVESVEFSDGELVWIGQADEETTIGDLKEAHELACEYSAELTEEQIAEINEQTVEAGDWVLISLKAFDTEESLTVTMKNGETLVVKVTDAQDLPMKEDGVTVDTITNPAGTTFDMFDYWVDYSLKDEFSRLAWPGFESPGTDGKGLKWNDALRGTGGNNAGINSSIYDTINGHALKFSPAYSHTVYDGTLKNWGQETDDGWTANGTDWNKVTTGLNSNTLSAFPRQGIVDDELSGGYPRLSGDSSIGATTESLQYLFDPNYSHDGKKSYPNVDKLLAVDEEGYYVYDSRYFAASLNGSEFTVSKQPYVYGSSEDTYEPCGFWPFGLQRFWLGMHMNTQFSMPKDGIVLNPQGEKNNMTFSFAGDDDTWLYIDGVLVGDGGGIHNRTSIDIDFATGKVVVSARNDENHYNEWESNNKTIYDYFVSALGESNLDPKDWKDVDGDGKFDTFADGTYHTFDMFYLERGGGESNLYIRYNLVSTADFTAHKAYNNNPEEVMKRDQFKFDLIGLDGMYNASGELVPGKENERALMPVKTNPLPSNVKTNEIDPDAGKLATPLYLANYSTKVDGSARNSQLYRTGVTEDGNINFGSAVISDEIKKYYDSSNPPVYHYIIREYVPRDATNENGVTYGEADDNTKKAGGFVKDGVHYDGTIYYMAATLIREPVLDGNGTQKYDTHGQPVYDYYLRKTYYEDDKYQTVKADTNFVNFTNRYVPLTGKIELTKNTAAGVPLSGAEFTLYTDQACTKIAKDVDGANLVVSSQDNTGIISFNDVPVGTYYMKETKAPTDYQKSNTVYKVTVEDSRDTTKKTKIIVDGDATETPVTQIVNTKPGELSVIKKWVDSTGKEVLGGNNSARVQLRRYKQEGTRGHSVNVNLYYNEISYPEGVYTVTQKLLETQSKSVVDGGSVTISWQDGNRGNGSIIVNGKNQVWSNPLTISNIKSDQTVDIAYYYNEGSNSSTKINNIQPSGEGSGGDYVADMAFPAETDTKATQTLASPNWAYTWKIGDGAGNDFSATDGTNPYLYYLVELKPDGTEVPINEEVQDGITLKEISYSPSKTENAGIQQGVITVKNEVTSPETIDIVIKKTDNAENNTNYLAGAVFKLEHRADSNGTFTNVSNTVVPELDSNSQFTVPTAGIKLTGLVDGQYRLQEITPPAGYVITNNYPVVFTVSNGTITSTDGTISGVRYSAAATSSEASFTIPNTPGYALPSTGGPGTRLFTILGSVLLLGAVVLLLRRRRTA